MSTYGHIVSLQGAVPVFAAADANPSRFVGMHFFNPVVRSQLIEVVVTPSTAPEMVTLAHRWAGTLGKQSIEVRDAPGFATSRLGLTSGLEAMRMVEERSEEHTSELQSLMRISYAVFCLKKKKINKKQ